MGETEVVMFSPPKKTTRSWTKSKTFSDLFSHLEIYLNKYLNWKHQINYIIINLIEANAMLSKIRRHVGIKTLKSIYYAIFESHLSYASLVWAQHSSKLHFPRKNHRKYHSG